MSGGIPVRKRDALRNLWPSSSKSGRNASAPAIPQPLSSSSGGSSQAPSTSAPGASPPTSDSFLTAALGKLTIEERKTIEQYKVTDISGTVQEVYDAAQKQKTTCEAKQWAVGDKVDKVILWIDRFKAVGDIAANADPIHIGLPWAGIRMLLDVAVADSRQMKALASGMSLALSESDRLRAYFAYFQLLPPGLTTQNFEKALVDSYVHVLRFLAQAIQVFSKNPSVRIFEAMWQDPAVSTFEKGCQELALRANFEAQNCDRELDKTRWLGAAQWKTELDAKLRAISELQTQIQGVQKSVDKVYVKFELSSLPRVTGASFKSAEESRMPNCLDGTRVDLLRRIIEWTASPTGKFIFWLRGTAGTGKSTISRTVAQTLDTNGGLGASFFFKRGHSGRTDARRFVPTIVAQLAALIPALQQAVAKALEKAPLVCDNGVQDQFGKLLLEPLLSLTPSQVPTGPMIIVVDALDECDNQDILKLLPLLAKLNGASELRLRIFITSRPEIPVEKSFTKVDGNLHDDIVLEEVQISAIAHDIRVYFEHEFARIKDDGMHTQLPYDFPVEWPTQVEIDMLVGLAVPLFIFASTVCRFVEEDMPLERLDQIIKQRRKPSSIRLEDDEHSCLRQTYLLIVQEKVRVADTQGTQEKIANFRNIVGSLVLLADPLPIWALARVLHVDEGSIISVLRGLKSVLRVPRDRHQPVELLHLSFRDFLVDQSNDDNKEFRVDEPRTHAALAYQCIRLLTKKLRADICDVGKPGTKRFQLTREQVAQHISRDVEYACIYWPAHLIASGEIPCDDGELHDFLEKSFLPWLEALSWLGKLWSAVAFLKSLSMSAKSSPPKVRVSVSQSSSLMANSCSESGECGRVALLLEDARRFLLRNQRMINLAPLQVYHSAMVFAPSMSMMRMSSLNQAPKTWARLSRLPTHWNAEILRLEGHSENMREIVFSPNGQFIAVAADDSTVRIWNAQTGEPLDTLAERIGCVSAVAFSDGELIASAHAKDGKVRLWNVQTGRVIQTLDVSSRVTFKLVFGPEGQIISLSDDCTARLWNISTGEILRTFEGRQEVHRHCGIGLSPDGCVVSIAGYRSTSLWNIQTGELINTLNIAAYYHKVVFSHDGRIASTSHDKTTVMIWSILTGELIQTIRHTDMVRVFAFSSDGQYIVSMQVQSHTLLLWDGHDGKLLRTLHYGLVEQIACSPSDGQVIATTPGAEEISLWNILTPEPEMQVTRKHWKQPVIVIVFSLDGKVIASGSIDGTVRIWKAQTGQLAQTLTGHEAFVETLAFSPDGQLLASAGNDGKALLWNVENKGQAMRTLKGHSEWFRPLVFSPDGQIVAAGSSDAAVWMWNTQSGNHMMELKGHSMKIDAIVFSPNGMVVASMSLDSTIRFWNTQTGQSMFTFEVENCMPPIAFSPNGQLFAFCELEVVHLWHVNTGKLKRSIVISTDPEQLEFSPDGSSIYVDSEVFDVDPDRARKDGVRVWSDQLEVRRDWIRFRGEDILSLPAEYRGACVRTHGNLLVVGHRTGRLSFFQLA